jgi:DNA-binding beta-propeller fold protein YncE/pimeloyl-ACP methyl ester carboxylesterase
MRSPILAWACRPWRAITAAALLTAFLVCLCLVLGIHMPAIARAGPPDLPDLLDAAPLAQTVSGHAPGSAIPGLAVPNGLAVDPYTHRLYITSRDSSILIALDGNTLQFDGATSVGAMPWGVALSSGKVYVASFTGGDVRVLRASDLQPLKTIPIDPGAQLTFAAADEGRGYLYVVGHRDNKLYVINTRDDTLQATVSSGGSGAFGLAVNPGLNRVYISHRESFTVVTLDGNNGWQPIYAQTIEACRSGNQPYALAYNPLNNRLYAACTTSGSTSVQAMRVFSVANSGLTEIAARWLQNGGSNGGGGITIDANTNDVLFTNSAANTVTIFDGQNNLLANIQAGPDPFGAAADPTTGRIYVGNRGDNTITVIDDVYSPDPALPGLTVSQKNACDGLSMQVDGVRVPYGSGKVTLSLEGQTVAEALINPAAQTFHASFTMPPTPGGNIHLIATDTSQRVLLGSTTLRTPERNLPIIFLPGIAGSEILADGNFSYTAAPDPQLSCFPTPDLCLLPRIYPYVQDEQIWLGGTAASMCLAGEWRYLDVLRLKADGRTPETDLWGFSPPLKIGRPLQNIGVYRKVYQPFFDWLKSVGYQEGATLFYFPYDWRKDLTGSEAALDAVINQARAASGRDKVVIIAHSTGGLVKRNYLLHYGAAKVDQVITLATPYLGSPKVAKYLEVGDDMGMGLRLGDYGLGMHPKEIKKLANNFGQMYDLLPSAAWFTPNPALDAGYDPRYLNVVHTEPGAVTVARLGYQETNSLLSSKHNAALLNQGANFANQGLGDMARLTDQYYAQRVAGYGIPTVGHLNYVHRRVCAPLCLTPLGPCARICLDLPESIEPALDQTGDDSVPVRSGIGGNIQPGDERYYLVPNVPHGDFPQKTDVQALVHGMLQGTICSYRQTPYGPWWPAATSGATASQPGAAAAPPSVPLTATLAGSQIRLFGTADLNVYDSLGRHAGPVSGLPGGGVENHIPGVMLETAGTAQVAFVQAGGPYTITLTGNQAAGAALLRVSVISGGEVVETKVYADIPMTTTTVATASLAGSGLYPAALTVTYAQGWPAQSIEGTFVQGRSAQDDIPPAGKITVDSTRFVTIEAWDNADGSGLLGIYYSLEPDAQHFTLYTGPFTLPPDAHTITAVATDGAGNSGPAGFWTQGWLPLLMKDATG